MNHPISGDELARAVGAESNHELRKATHLIKHCVSQLSDAQVWWRPSESQNSIGNLILHLCGNLRQWAISGLGGEKDVRNRPQEFAERSAIPKLELLSRLESVVAQAMEAFSSMTTSELLRVRRIQGFEVTGLAVIFSTVPHFRGHTQEIVLRTRLLLGENYQFAWKPETREQGAPE